MKTIPATYARGGTSRAIIFRRADLPEDMTSWGPMFAAALGSPDPDSHQLDGLGGGITSLSKIAIVSPSSRSGFDIDYLFAQIDPVTGDMSLGANCGNISSAVGPFSVSQGWATADDRGQASVRIWNENTGKLIVSEFPINPSASDAVSIAGVAGKAAPINLSFFEPGDSAGKGTFPTGHTSELLKLPSGETLEVTLIDVNVPCAILRASALGLTGQETYGELTANKSLVAKLRDIRVASALKMGLCQSSEEALTTVLNVPDVVLIEPDGEATDRVHARFVSCDRPHRAAPVTSSMGLAAAAHVSGTVAFRALNGAANASLTILHPSGTMPVKVDLSADGTIRATSVLRTARTLMTGEVYLP